MFSKARNVWNEYPRTFWVLIGATFIDRVGGALLFPFFSLYITSQFDVGMIEVGIIFSIFAITSLVGGTLGGALTDKFGRKIMLILGLAVSGASSLMMSAIQTIEVFYLAAIIMGLFANIGNPAQQAMIADILPSAKQAEGFGVLRVTANLAVTIGPALGGLLASQSYFYLFLSDFIASMITVVIVIWKIPETKPDRDESQPEESMGKTMIGYFEVLKDNVFMLFLMVMAAMELVYMQMNSTLSVFLRDNYGFTASYFGYLISMNATMVVLFQFWITRRISKYSPMYMMTIGSLLYCIGFGMYGFVTKPVYFFLAMFIITIGEMIIAPFGHSLAARFAPEDKRGRYMAVRDFTWGIPNIFGVLGAGIIMDYFDGRWVWYIAAILCVVVALGYFALHAKVLERIKSIPCYV